MKLMLLSRNSVKPTRRMSVSIIVMRIVGLFGFLGHFKR